MNRKSFRIRKMVFLIGVLLIFAFPAVMYAGEEKASQKEETGEPFRAIIVTDLHYTTSRQAVDTIVSGINLADEITDAMVNEVIALRPDAFIMTGDNTNNGSRENAQALAKKLRRIRDAGIAVVVTTGNHDMNLGDLSSFEDCYSDLSDPEQRDPASLSFVQVVNGVALFAMDDNAVEPGGLGRFSANTMEWLEKMLQEYADRFPVVFLSHHNVLAGMGAEGSEHYRINNDDLPELLRNYGVHLIFTGHLHSQMLEEWNGMYEIVNAMPLSGEHTLGMLDIRVQDTEEVHYSVHYAIEPIDLAEYGEEGLAEELHAKDIERDERFREWFWSMLDAAGCPEQLKEKAADLMQDFFRYYSEGTLSDHRDEILKDPAYSVMIEVLKDSNYGPWMQATIESVTRNAGSLDEVF